MKFILITAASGGLALAAGCSDTTMSASDTYSNNAVNYNAMLADIRDTPITTAAQMPLSGSATYNGYATVLTGIDTALTGNSQITANFSTSTLTGNLSNFAGTVNGGDDQFFDGGLSIKGGEIGEVTASGITGDIKGTLTGESTGDTVTVIGGVEGEFHGNGADSLAALNTDDTDFIVNGIGVAGDLGIVAQR